MRVCGTMLHTSGDFLDVGEFVLPAKASLCAGRTAALVKAAAMGDAGVVGELCEGLRVSSYWWGTALRKASANGNTAVVRVMLRSLHRRLHKDGGGGGVRTDVVDGFLHTAANVAAQNGHGATLEELINHRAPLLVVGSDSPLHMAVRGGHTAVAEALLSAGSTVEPYGNANQDSPMSLARRHHHPALAHLLRKYAASPRPPAFPGAGRNTAQKGAAPRHPHLSPRPPAAAPPAFASPAPPVPPPVFADRAEARARGRLLVEEDEQRRQLANLRAHQGGSLGRGTVRGPQQHGSIRRRSSIVSVSRRSSNLSATSCTSYRWKTPPFVPSAASTLERRVSTPLSLP